MVIARLSFLWFYAFAWLMGWTTSAEPLQFRAGVRLVDGSADLLPGTPGSGYSIPCVTDWNGDGRKDLLVGYQTAGKIALYLNQGTDSHPCFTNFRNLRTGAGDEILHPSNGCGAPAPWVCDFDDDGRRDLLVGAGQDGSIWFYRNTNTDALPILDAGIRLQAGDSPISVGMRATPYYYDWDQDGRKDLLCGSGDGYVYFFKNTNSTKVPLFAPGIKIRAGGVDLSPGIRSLVRVFDLDADGLNDLVCSSDTGVYWCRNTNRNSNIQLEPPVPVYAPVAGSGLIPLVIGTVPGARMRIELTDWDGDGTPDLLVGNHEGTVLYYQGYAFRIQSLIRDSDRAVLQWSSAPDLNYNVLVGIGTSSILSIAAPNVPSAGNLTSWTNQAAERQQFYRLQVAH